MVGITAPMWRCLMALGYGGNDDWRDMSEYLVHMTNSSEALFSILRSRRVEARNAYGAVRNHEALVSSQRVVCLSEIPLDHLGRLATKHGRFGLAFRKAALSPIGAAPVWYLNRGTRIQRQVFSAVYDAAYQNQPPDPDLLLWRLTPFIDYPGVYGHREYKWEWEREWRKVGDLAVRPEEIPFVFAPEEQHSAVSKYWWESMGAGLSPVLLDAAWPLELIQEIATREDL